MKLRIVTSFLLIVLLCGCKQNKTVISGAIEHSNSSYLLLMQIFPDEVVTVDTVLLLNGNFSHRIKSEQVGVYLLRFSDDVFLSFIANKGDKLVFSGDADNLLESYNIQGNEETKLLIENNRKLDQVYKETETLSKEFIKHTNNGNLDSIRIIDSLYAVLFEQHRVYLTNFIRSNPDKLASLMAFYQTLGRNAFFSIKEDRNLLEEIYPALVKKYPNSVYANDLKEKLEIE